MKITVIEDSIEEAENFERVCLSKLTHLLDKARTENTRIEKIRNIYKERTLILLLSHISLIFRCQYSRFLYPFVFEYI